MAVLDGQLPRQPPLGSLEIDAFHQLVHRMVALGGELPIQFGDQTTDSSVSLTITGPKPNSCPLGRRMVASRARIDAAPPKPAPAASPIR